MNIFKIKIIPKKEINRRNLEIDSKLDMYICTKDNHNKFYKIGIVKEYDSSNYIVYKIYGRIGSVGVENSKYFTTITQANKDVNTKVKDLLKKGYTKVN